MKTKLLFLILGASLSSQALSLSIVDKPEDSAKLIVKGNTDFAFDLYQQLKSEDGNLFFSPYSISTALAMTFAGADRQTAEQMVTTLHFLSCRPAIPSYPLTAQLPFHSAYGRLIDQLNIQGQKGDYQLSIANALWVQKDFPFLNEFLDLNKQYYKAGLENVDFKMETEKSRNKINQWVEQQTQDKIKDLIPAGTLDAMTRLVLTNAIYFKGDWALQFDTKRTKKLPFYVSPEKPVTAALMFQKDTFKYGETDMLQMLELPYKGDDLSMLVLLPKQDSTLAKLEGQLTADKLDEWQKTMRKRKVEVFLPKFKMTSQFSLGETLAAMGMPDAFDAFKADFSGMTGSKDLFISAVMHKAFVEVNEEGTEAAAATGAVMAPTSIPAPPPVFRADRPFVFIIKDNNTASILFVGRVIDPTKN